MKLKRHLKIEMYKDNFTVVVYRDGFAIKNGRELSLKSDGSIMFYKNQEEAIIVCEELNKEY